MKIRTSLASRSASSHKAAPFRPALKAGRAASALAIGLACVAFSVVDAHASGSGLGGMLSTASSQSQTGAAEFKYFCYLIGAVTAVLGYLNVRKDDPRERAKGAKEFVVSVLAFGVGAFEQKIAQTLGLNGTHASSTLG